MNEIDRLLELLKEARFGAVFTGAGISTLSGIRDFRGKNGVYKEPWRGMPVESLLSIDTFERDPSLFYGWAREFVYRLDAFSPGPVHRVVAKLEELGYIKEVFTQNIDLLHQRAGSRNVWELHGSPAKHYCRRCGKEFSYDEIAVRSGAKLVIVNDQPTQFDRYAVLRFKDLGEVFGELEKRL